ncbi:3-dehydroquinate synthase [bacterium 210917-DFI.7.65]|nr:3-dehydroquinate synthase [bacterium 210917-DFI.7.65]
MKQLTVELPGREYDILIGTGLLEQCGARIRAVTRAERLAVVTDSNVGPLYLKMVMESLLRAGFTAFSVTFPAGEASKNIRTLNNLYEGFADGGLTRGDGVVALGGGVTGDMAGFAAATMFRGVDFIQIPTTLLAQVDSSVGGKTAIDLPQGKNLVGAFYQPKLVLADTGCFATLPNRVLCDGMAEVIKYGMIVDAPFFDFLERLDGIQAAAAHWEEIVYTCCDIKRAVVAEDERDTGRRGILNFGHTLGHAYEKAYHYETYTHGEAVAAGMVKMLELERRKGRPVAALQARLERVLKAFQLPIEIPCTMEDYRAAVGLDKKAQGRCIGVIEVVQPGQAEIVPMEKEALFALLEEKDA